jgi:hypothetical protein
VSAAPRSLELRYRGWSGFEVRAPGRTAVLVDPAPDREIADERAIILVTHGHPEHVAGSLAHLRKTSRAPVTVIASAPICRYLERRTAGREDRFLRVAPRDRLEVLGWSVRVFGWTHMSLLPPGMLPAARYLATLLRHPRGLARMAWGDLRGPAHAPMLGYHVSAGAGGVVYYGEGLHRLTSRRALEETLGPDPIDALVFGAEPEDVDALPALLAGHEVGRAIAFEPHRPWREDFGLPQLDAEDLVSRLSAAGLDALAVRADQTITVGAAPLPSPKSSSGAPTPWAR